MEDGDMRIQSVLYDLQKFASKENEISSLTTLNEIISTSQEEVEFLYNSNALNVIMSFLESDSKLTNICLKILVNASKRHEKVRSKLLENNIFHVLAGKLKSETDFSNSNLNLYSALLVLLLQGNYEAQNQMRASGCLSSVVYILSCILDETEDKPLPPKITELIIYVIIASNKNPRHVKNQTEVGWIMPKILQYLDKQTNFWGSNQLNNVKCFWFFVKTILDRSELNQQIFLNSFGFGVLFRSIQSIVAEENCEEMWDLLVKMTGVLVKFKYNKEFLSQASNYCPVMILASVLKTCNSLILQQTIIFLDRLTQEFPEALEIMKGSEILRRMERATIILLKSEVAAEISQNLWSRMNISHTTPNEQPSCSDMKFGLSLISENQNFLETTAKLNFPQTHLCVVHDTRLITTFKGDSEPFFSITKTTEAIENKKRIESLSKIRFSSANLRLKMLKEREKKLRKVISQNFSYSPKVSKNRFNIVGMAGKKIMQIFKKFFSFFNEEQDDGYDATGGTNSTDLIKSIYQVHMPPSYQEFLKIFSKKQHSNNLKITAAKTRLWCTYFNFIDNRKLEEISSEKTQTNRASF